MKTRILLLTMAAPMIFALLLGITLYTTHDPFKIFVAITFFFVVLGSRLLSDTRYVRDINITTTTLEIQYYTALLKLRSLKVPISDAMHIKLLRGSWITNYFATLFISKDEETYRFFIGRKAQLEQLEIKLSQLIQQAGSGSSYQPAKS